MENLILYKKGESSWVRWIKKRIKNNLNLNALFTGPTGIGKSFNAIEIARQIDPEFDVTKQISFSFPGLMKIINQFNNPTDSNLHKKKYKVVIFDEAQTSTNRRDWQSKVNRFLNHLLSTYRHQNIITLFTSPYEDFLDSAAIKLFHVKFECKGWSKKTKKSRMTPKIYQYNAQRSKMYEHPLYVIRDGMTSPLRSWSVNCPPKEMTDLYEIEKFKFTNALNLKITLELEAMEQAENDNDGRKPLNPLSCQDDLWKFCEKKHNEGNGWTGQVQLGIDFGKSRGMPNGMSVGQLNLNKQSMARKGWNIEIFKKVKN